MKLLTKALSQQFPAIYATDGFPPERKMVIAKFFDPSGAGTWYAFEADALVDRKNEVWEPLADVVKARKPYHDVKFFGYTTGLGTDELGYFLLSELEGARGRYGLGIERDIFYKPESFADLQKQGQERA
jgi:hypothetical protein